MDCSIIMTTYNRPRQLLNTLTSISKQFQHPEILGCPEIVVVDDGTDDRTLGICDAFHVNYIKLNRPVSDQYRNQARLLNVGIRAAKGDVIILQNAECKHMAPNVITDLTSLVTDTNCVFARVISMNEDGSPDQVYCGEENKRPYFFCGAIRREILLQLRGFDEDYQGYGYEDDDMAERLLRAGVQFVYTDIEVHHQWHEPAGVIDPDMQAGREMYDWKKSTGVERNLGREWGAL